ncbi:DUF3899 domain-containing protein [Oceanobacillus sp. 1P07AA]|uniref:DUF3899 domain-containing protein n=1 Tax=Oceanobacillus sp. 1P07AA TaxID=3132293 RepID=UPI0039A5D491
MLKKVFLWVGISQLLIILITLLMYKRLDLLSYINVAFVIGSILLLISLTLFVIKGRFFDIVFFSFQNIFSRMEDKDRSPLSKLVPQNYSALFIASIVTIVIMLAALLLQSG